jgi:hypothetical protein
MLCKSIIGILSIVNIVNIILSIVNVRDLGVHGKPLGRSPHVSSDLSKRGANVARLFFSGQMGF